MIIIGGGIAGLMAALAAAPRPVLLLNSGTLGSGAASSWSQGGIAAAIGDDDSPALHIADTLAAGAGLCNLPAVTRIIESGPQIIETLLGLGVRFDLDAEGNLARGLEAAHARRRILHAAGDRTGAEIMRALMAAVRQTPSITILDAAARHIFSNDAGVTGVLAEKNGETFLLPADRILLATGGIGALFRDTTNPPGAIGAGLMLASQAGAALQHLEFIQFHPTALDVGGGSLPLISEAVRGEGAVFVDETGQKFMNGGDLAPRDVVARAVFAHQALGHRVFLDARSLGARFHARFPAISAICTEAGIDPEKNPIPVRPAAHYHMGGVAVDMAGQTTIPGLFAAGEVACTGLHGANRLASNSLLEAAFCGQQAGMAMMAMAPRKTAALPNIHLPRPPDAAPVRAIMSAHLGVLRDPAGLDQAIDQLSRLAPGNPAARLGLAIASSARARPASIGAHAMRDVAEMKNAA